MLDESLTAREMKAIEIAIHLEKDSIKFYTEASEKTDNQVGKSMFLSIVEDEKRHLETLSQIFKGLDITCKDVSPMEKMYKRDGFPEGCLIKLTLKKGCLQKIRNALSDHGITDSVVFPELDGLAREIKRGFGFEV